MIGSRSFVSTFQIYNLVVGTLDKQNQQNQIHNNRISEVVDREQYFALKIRTILREPATVSQV